ncbi:MAG: NTP pyrophosphohydrolase [Candidatus Riflebacteria bacterium HGW-Riflebacteria-1]|jgi:NTP pyrophosphatase (non-canonical NTP hydrolase)|nr:MAG: NTP pyrophosphohydrolase [Candidatus Riflebacteria bacterium HGW-Riflebacteria-1]
MSSPESHLQSMLNHSSAGEQTLSDANTSIDELKSMVEKFVSDRSWHKYHTPKNIAISVVLEASELLEHFQWSPPASEEIDSNRHQQIAEEMCDVMAYLLSLANVLKVDMASEMAKKMRKNCQKYPTQDYDGNWKKPEPLR